MAMSIEDFVERFIEGYIFGDLETMSHSQLASGKRFGAVGYPMVATALAGMELLGGLLTPHNKTFETRGMSKNFLNYWDNYFVKEYPQYKGLGRLFYSLIRNGIGHVFIAKHGIVVNKFAGPAILVDLPKNELYLNPNELYKEFERSYTNQVKPILDGRNASTGLTSSIIEARISDIEADYAGESRKNFTNLPPLDQSILTQDYWARIGWQQQSAKFVSNTARASGASISLGPLNTPPIITLPTTTQSDPPFPTVS